MGARSALYHVLPTAVLVSCSLLSIFPWAISALSSPLPPELQRTGTILSITRTARFDPELAGRLVKAIGYTATPAPTQTFTITPTSTFTWTATPSPTPTLTTTFTPTPTMTPLPEVRGTVKANINTYTCPGSGFKKGGLQFGAAFHVLGWDESIEDGKVVTWLLIEDVIHQPQRWLQESGYITLSHPDFKEMLPRVACRQAS